MSVLRLGLHRAGLIDKMVPQAVEEWISDRLNIDPPGGTAGHHVADQLLHLAYGAGLGALGGPMVSGRQTRGGLWRGAAFGLASWAFGMLVLVPSLRVARPAWRARSVENATNIALLRHGEDERPGQLRPQIWPVKVCRAFSAANRTGLSWFSEALRGHSFC